MTVFGTISQHMPDSYVVCLSAILTSVQLKSCLSFCLSVSAPVSEASPYEMIRSQELNALLGPKGSAHAVDLLCDLHNTTANMGLCLITYSDRDWIILHICKHLQARTNQRSSLAWLMYLMVKHIYVSMCVFREKWPPLLSDTFTLIFLSMKPILWIRWGSTDLVRVCPSLIHSFSEQC